jgi:hypothetical protein
MAGIQPLISISHLKTKLLAAATTPPQPLVVQYDHAFDAVIVQFVPLEVETVVHYMDDHVGLLYRADDLEVVGIHVENFELSFLPKHDTVRRVWRLSDSGGALANYGDITLIIERMKPQIAREVVKATEGLLGEPGHVLAKAIA